MQTFKVLACGVLTLLASAAIAAPLSVTSYDMRNGDGNANGGTYNYWDAAYSGTGATTTDGAVLTGGTGDLTDGVTALLPWYVTENGAGTGPYVGWRSTDVVNPSVTFNFASGTTIKTISIALDNSNIGGVYAPTSILLDGLATPFAAPADGTVGIVTFTGLNLTGTSHSIQFITDTARGSWVFVSEVAFDGTTVPEPATWALMIGGFGLVGVAVRRRRGRYATA